MTRAFAPEQSWIGASVFRAELATIVRDTLA
jgi:hypothetical protein